MERESPSRGDVRGWGDALAAPHAYCGAAVAHALRTAPEGLRPDEAALRLSIQGPNRVADEEGSGLLERWLAELRTWPCPVLLGAALVAALVGHWVDSVAIAVACAGGVAAVLAQRSRAERVADDLRERSAPPATVIRGDERFEVEASALAAGDIVVLRAGDRVPADIRLSIVEGLVLDESWLPGGAPTAAKRAEPVRLRAPASERASMALAGSTVVCGCARGYVTATGPRTELGRCAMRVGHPQRVDVDPAVWQRTRRFADVVAMVLAVCSALAVALSLLVRPSPAEALLAAVSVAAAAVLCYGLVAVTAAVPPEAAANRADLDRIDGVGKAAFFAASVSTATVIAVLAGVLVGLPLPLLPAQVLWVGFLASLCASALACEPPAPDAPAQPPLGSDEHVLAPWLWERTVLIGGLMAACSVGLYAWALSAGESLEAARGAGLTTLVVAMALHTASARSERRSALSPRALPGRRLVWAQAGAVLAQAWALQASLLRPVLRVEAIGAVWWLRAAALGLLVLAVSELHKLWERSGSSDGAVSAAPVALKR